MKFLVITMAVALIVGALPAFADEITISSSSQTNYFCSDGTSIFLSSSSSCTVGATTFSGMGGQFFSPPGNPALQNQPWSLVFPAGFSFQMISDPSSTITNAGGTDFSFGTGADTLAGTITWTVIRDGSPFPVMTGHLFTPGGGTGVLAGDYGAHSTYPAVITLDILGTPRSLISLQGTPAGTETPVSLSTGEIPAIPEPATALLLGTGLLLAGTLLRRRGCAK